MIFILDSSHLLSLSCTFPFCNLTYKRLYPCRLFLSNISNPHSTVLCRYHFRCRHPFCRYLSAVTLSVVTFPPSPFLPLPFRRHPFYRYLSAVSLSSFRRHPFAVTFPPSPFISLTFRRHPFCRYLFAVTLFSVTFPPSPFLPLHFRRHPSAVTYPPLLFPPCTVIPRVSLIIPSVDVFIAVTEYTRNGHFLAHISSRW